MAGGCSIRGKTHMAMDGAGDRSGGNAMVRVVSEHGRRVGLVFLIVTGVVGLAASASAECVSVNGSALNNLAANDTVNCSGAGSADLSSTNDGVTVNLLPGMQQGTGANFATLANSNTFEGSGFYILSGGSVIDAGNANTLHLSNGYLSGSMFGIALQDNAEVSLAAMEIHGVTTALSFGDALQLALTDSFIESANYGLLTGINGTVTIERTTFDTGATAIAVDSGSEVTMTGGSIVSATHGIVADDSSTIVMTESSVDVLGTASHGLQLGDSGGILLTDSTVAANGVGSEAILLGGGNIVLVQGSSLSAFSSNIDGANGNVVFVTDSGLAVHGAAATGIALGNQTIFSATGSTITTDAAASQGILAGDNSLVTLTEASVLIGDTGNGIHIGDASGLHLDHSTVSVAGATGNAVLVSAGSTSGLVELIGSTLTANDIAIQLGDSGTFTVGEESTVKSTGGTAIVGGAGLNALVIAETTISGAAYSIDLGGGDDLVLLADGSNLISAQGANGGAGAADHIRLLGSNAEDETFVNFETLTMEGIDWALSGASTFADIQVQTGRLRINGPIGATNGAVVDSAGIIGGSGNLTTPLLDVSGGTAPGNSVGTLTVTGNFLQNGGFMEVEYDGSGIDLLDVTGTVTLAGAPTLIVKPLSGAGGAAGTFLNAAGGLTGTFDAVDFQGNGGATIVYSANQATLFAAQPTAVVAEDTLILGLGEQILGTIGGQQSHDAGEAGRKIWGTGLGFFTARDAMDGNAGYEADSGGALMGADLYAKDGWRFGLGGGYAHTSIEIDDGAGDSDLNGAFGLAYGGYGAGRWFLNGRLMAGWQDVNASRTIANEDDLSHAASDSDAWLLGAGLSTGMHLDFENGWRLTPRFNLDYVQQWHGSAHERSADGGEIDVDDYSTASLTASAMLRAGQTYDLQDLTLEPFLQFGAAQRIGLGDRQVDASFQDNDDTFNVDLDHDTRTIGIVGTGIVMEFANGVDLEMDYQGNLGGGVAEHSIFAKLRSTW
jgi:uncharacterized protein with beta-barrel porin domain